MTLSIHAELATLTDVSSDDPDDFGVVTGVAGPAGCGQTADAVVVVTAGAAVVELFTAVVGGAVVAPTEVLLGLDVDVAVDALLPLLLHAASTIAAKQTHAE